MSVNVVTVKNLFFRYEACDVLSDVSFSVKEGDYVGIVGPNGSGKTTLIKIILGLLKPSQGDVLLFDEPAESFTKWELIGYLPQRMVNLNPRFPASVKEVVGMGLLSRKKFPRHISPQDERDIKNALETVGIVHLIHTPFGDISGGQQQRVLVARALVNRPSLLILDEPTNTLDPEMRDRFFSLLDTLNKEKNLTTLLVTHDIGNIGIYASKLLYLDKRVIFYGSFDEFCRSDEVTEYFGTFAQHIICHRHT